MLQIFTPPPNDSPIKSSKSPEMVNSHQEYHSVVTPERLLRLRGWIMGKKNAALHMYMQLEALLLNSCYYCMQITVKLPNLKVLGCHYSSYSLNNYCISSTMSSSISAMIFCSYSAMGRPRVCCRGTDSSFAASPEKSLQRQFCCSCGIVL